LIKASTTSTARNLVAATVGQQRNANKQTSYPPTWQVRADCRPGVKASAEGVDNSQWCCSCLRDLSAICKDIHISLVIEQCAIKWVWHDHAVVGVCVGAASAPLAHPGVGVGVDGGLVVGAVTSHDMWQQQQQQREGAGHMI
jgi:hypothetical protein